MHSPVKLAKTHTFGMRDFCVGSNVRFWNIHRLTLMCDFGTINPVTGALVLSGASGKLTGIGQLLPPSVVKLRASATKPETARMDLGL